MSKYIKNDVACPECGNIQEFVAWESINPDLDPDLKDKILTGELFTFKCEKCGKMSPITYPCLYNDMFSKTMIYLTQEEDAASKMNEILFEMQEAYEIQKRQGYEYRIVKTVNELAEKIMIKDMGLDDRVVEIVKALIMIKSESDGMDIDTILGLYYYPGKENRHQIVILLEDGRQAVIPLEQQFIEETSEALKDRIEANIQEGYQKIDVEWVTKVLK